MNEKAESAAHTLVEEDESKDPTDNSSPISSSSGGSSKSRKRKHKVFIHSSPFQRCVQTSIGISAGLAQFKGSSTSTTSATSTRPRSDSKAKSARDLHSASPRLLATDLGKQSALEPIIEPRDLSREVLTPRRPHPDEHSKTTLRVDAFLGEWLSPDYFDSITPPPNSTLMVAGAKADLLRGGETLHASDKSSTPKSSSGNLWGAASSDNTDGPLDNFKSMSHALPRRDRTNSYSGASGSSSNGSSSPLRTQATHVANATKAEQDSVYIAPQPTYAISPAEPIPKGYVAHARDACVTIDYQWDSMREPLLWGNGGEYGEEWSAMHKRFRRGFHDMVDWYDQHDIREDHDNYEALAEAKRDKEDDDEDTDIVVVMVTHGAGCNALIGALTDQPVLLDVGMASLTMAVRKEDRLLPNGKPSSPALEQRSESPRLDGAQGRRGSINLGMSLIYDMKMVASADHLRPGVDPSRLPAPIVGSTMSAAQTVPDSRRRLASLSSHAAAGSPSDAAWNVGELARHHSMSSALGSIRRGSAAHVQPLRNGSVSALPRGSITTAELPRAESPSGLWSPSTPPLPEKEFEQVPKDRTSHELPRDSTISPPDSRPNSSDKFKAGSTNHVHFAPSAQDLATSAHPNPTTQIPATDGAAIETSDSVSALPRAPPSALGRTLSQKGLWGSAPKGGDILRERGPKRRWTLQQE